MTQEILCSLNASMWIMWKNIDKIITSIKTKGAKSKYKQT